MRNLVNEFENNTTVQVFTGSVEPGKNLNIVPPDDNNPNPVMNVDDSLVNISLINGSTLPPVIGQIAILADINNAIANIEFPNDIDLTKAYRFATTPTQTVYFGNTTMNTFLNGNQIF